MNTFKNIGNRIKVILTQLIAFILSFFKSDEDGGRVLKKDDAKVNTVNTKKDTIIPSSSTPLPDEADTKSDNHLTYKQSISTVNKEVKEEIKSKVKAKEIYFSEIVIINTIVEVVEEKNNFKFSELSDDKKDKVKKEVEKINDIITPTIKKEMLNNKIKTKEELKTNIAKKINTLHYSFNPIKKIITEKAPQYAEPEEKKPEIVIEDKELNIKPIKKKKSEHFFTIAPIKKDKEEDTRDKEEDTKELVTIKKEEKHKHIDHEDEVYFMADILPDKKNNMNLPKTVKIDTEKSLVSEAKKETAEAMKIKTEKIPFMMVPNNNENKIPAKERIKNAVIDTAILLASLPEKKENEQEHEEKEVVKDGTPIKSIYKSAEEEISPEEVKIADIELDKEILEDIRKDIKKQQQVFNPFMEEAKKPTDEKEIARKEKIDNIKNLEKEREQTIDIKQGMIDKKEDILEDIEKEQKDIIARLDELTEKIQKEEEKEKKEEIVLPIGKEEQNEPSIEEILEEITEKKEPEKKESKKEEKKEISEEIAVPIAIEVKEKVDKKENKEIKNLHKNTESVIINTNNELKKEELEDKEYDKYASQIDDLLYDIEMYKIKNEDSISPSDREKLNQEKNKLKSLKNKLETQRDLDIAKEKKELEAMITAYEIEGIQEELKQLHLEHQEEANDSVIEKLSKLEEKNDKKLAELEQQLIKSKLKKAARAAEIPSFLALPFVRHKYFFYFTIGLFVNNHFNFLNAIFKRKNIQYEPIDLTEIKNGYDALDKALDQTYENIVYLDYLENESLTKYPSLKDDEEFTNYIERLRTKLNSNYEKLERKQKMINKYIKKVNKKNKVYKKYKLIKEENNS